MKRGAFLLGLAVVSASLSARAQENPSEAAFRAPPQGAWFHYRFEQRMEGQGGAYAGYDESTLANARYEVQRVEGDSVTIRAQYAWRYNSPERTDEGIEDRTVDFSLATRLYTSARTDSSDYDAQNASSLAQWLWIPRDVQPGTSIQIFDHTFRVIGEQTIDVLGTPRQVITLRAEYADERNDAYGRLTTTITDEYDFDHATGMFVRERHREQASGTLEGQSASFVLVTSIDVLDASYMPAAEPLSSAYDFRTPPRDSPASDDYGSSDYGSTDYGSRDYRSERDQVGTVFERSSGFLCCVVIAVLLLVPAGLFIWLLNRKPKRQRSTASGDSFHVERASASLPLLPGLSPLFDPFIPHMMRVAEAAGQNVVVARGLSGNVLGVGIGDRDADIGTIFAPDSDVCEALRFEIAHSEFFSDKRHPKLSSVFDPAAPPEAYNVYETYEIKQLQSQPDDLGFDREVVSPMKPEDRAGVVALLDAVYGVPCGRWLDASLSVGDLAWVARDGDRIVGCALASVVGAQARLHTLTVDAEHRNKGIGTALYRARLRALLDLGASAILTECAAWNIGALEIANAHGFSTIGTMYIESARDTRAERKFVRR
jgi:GNAT superfamily N-acetyltransferase